MSVPSPASRDSIDVLIIEDSASTRHMLEQVISTDSRLRVVASVGSAEEGLELLPQLRPDVVSMDIQLPGMNGVEATRKIMRDCPTPVVVVSASVDHGQLRTSMDALKAGALSVVEKPTATTHPAYEGMAEKLCAQLVHMSEVRVIRQRLARNEGEQPISRVVPGARNGRRRGGPFRALGIVASTGGPAALENIFGDLGPEYPLPILLVQHITKSFLEGFASWLDSICDLHIKVAASGERPRSGTVHVAPPGKHLRLAGEVLRLEQGRRVCGQCPSGNVLLESMAESIGSAALAVVLTGMGRDGASGLLEVRKAGGYTIAEHRSSALVFGMPRAAIELGAACDILPLHRIPSELRSLCEATRGGTS